MNFIVINGSPKTKSSITLQHMLFLENKHPQHKFEFVSIGNKIPAYEKKGDLLDALIEKMHKADAVVWSFPVYYALVPSQLKRFMELLFERCPENGFKGCYTTSFTTSINFFDHTAHNYMQGVCENLGFSYIDSYSAHMNDFFHSYELEKMTRFFSWFSESVSQKIPVTRKYSPVIDNVPVYAPDIGTIQQKAGFPLKSKKILLLTDEQESDVNIRNMTQVFCQMAGESVQKENIHQIGLKNGCLGCCTCGYDNVCAQKDGFVQFYNSHVKTADVIIIAGSIKDHYLSSQWKKFFDRSFFNGHAPVLKDKRIGFMISGPLSQIQNLREVLEALAQVWHTKPFGIVTDEQGNAQQVSEQIDAFAENLLLAEKNDLAFGAKFYQVGGSKIFRDFVFSTSAVFRADDIFYKKMGLYDTFPQRKLKKRVGNAVFAFFLALKPIRKKIHQKFISGMVTPYKKVLKKTVHS